MKTICVDDERLGLERFRTESAGLNDIEMIGEFDSPLEALTFARKTRVELAFLDIVMSEMNGMDLSDQLRGIYAGAAWAFTRYCS